MVATISSSSSSPSPHLLHFIYCGRIRNSTCSHIKLQTVSIFQISLKCQTLLSIPDPLFLELSKRTIDLMILFCSNSVLLLKTIID
jgi:hypothetical protein